MIINRSDCIINAQFEEDVINSSGTNGTVTGTEQYIDSISGQGFDFDGSTYVSFGNSGLSNASDLTIFTLIDLDTQTNGDKMFGKRTAGNANAFFMTITATAALFRVRNAANSAWVSASLTVDMTTVRAMRFEINLTNDITVSAYDSSGVLTTVSTAFADATYTTNADDITTGDLDGGNDGMDGYIDNFTVITSILTDEDFYRYYMGLGITDL